MATAALLLEELDLDNPEDRNITHELGPICRQRQLFVLIFSFLAICITTGVNQSYGVFQSYHRSPHETMLRPSARNQSALVIFGSRIMGALSALGMAGGFVFASLSTQLDVDFKLAMRPAFMLSVFAAFLQAGAHGLPLTFLSEYLTVLDIQGWGRQNTLIATVTACIICVPGFWFSSVRLGGNRALWILFVVWYGAASGGYNSLLPTIIVDFFGLQAIPSINGCINVVLLDVALIGHAMLCIMGARWSDAIDKVWKWKA
ncbi:hypothetical protein BJ878DRAFT_532698 [Calycina marina]|uniref:Uncharacterized protein n=1 Tax=Calycina marina TaxID=1763456 RepID=A0A9P8CHU4_9HELO|nr:hypothetical protein BJ878DRAFT_532698 [Calycina marina]